MSTQWVCSRWNKAPKDEEKFLVEDVGAHTYHVVVDGIRFSVPKSHYVPCEAPVVWERVEVRLKWITTPEMRAKGAFIGEEVETGKEVLSGEVRRYYEGYRVVSLVVERRKT